jgi:uncharacterized membrane protein
MTYSYETKNKFVWHRWEKKLINSENAFKIQVFITSTRKNLKLIYLLYKNEKGRA